MSIYQKIKEFEQSKLRKQYKVGRAYYDCDNIEINQRKFEVAYKNEKGFAKRYEDIWKANNKVSTGYYPLLVDQKIDFVLSNPITYEGMNDADLEYFDNKFQYDLEDAATIAASEGKAWVFPYVEDNKLKRKIIEADYSIPEYDNRGNLIKMIHYTVETYKKGVNENTIYLAQVWDDKTVKIYEIKDGNEKLVSEKYHIRQYIKYTGGEMIKTGVNSWGKVPFVELRNDKKGIYDLKRVKPAIDGMDLISSDFLNNLEDFQDVFWVIKNYGGTNVDSLLKEIKDLKVLKVGQDGDAKPETIDIPHEARVAATQIFESYIYKFGRGVDIDANTGADVTNVNIKSRYQNLISKSKRFSKQATKFIQDYAYFVSVHANRTIEPKPIYTYDMIINETELAEALVNSVGVISDQTIWEKYPYAASDEAERMTKQREQRLAQYNTGFGNNSEEE